jgi:hypothetical protein
MGESQDQSLEAETLIGGLRNRWNRACPWLSAGNFGAVILVAVLLRIGLILAWPQPVRGTDADQYIRLATNLVEGNGYSLWPNAPYDPDVYRSPGYPLFLAVALKAGLGLRGIIGLQVFLELTTLVLAAGLFSRKVSPAAGRGAFVAAMLCPFTAAIPTLLLSESLALPLITAIFIISLTALRRRAVLLGLCWGLLVLTRGGFLPGLGLAAALLGWEERRRPTGSPLRAIVHFSIAALLILAPYGVWNLNHHGRFSVTPLAGFGRAIWGSPMTIPALGPPPLPNGAWETHNAIWGDGTFRPTPLELIEADQILGEAGKNAIKENPVTWLAGGLRNGLHLWVGVREFFPFSNPRMPGWIYRGLSLAFLGLALFGWSRLPWSGVAKLQGIVPMLASAITLPWIYMIMRYTTVLFGPISLLAGAAFFRKRRP